MVSVEVNLIQEDTDGSETLELIVINIPDGVYVANFSHVGNSTWKQTPEAEVVLVNITAVQGHLYPINFNLTVVSKETSNGDKYEYTETFDLEPCPEITTAGSDDTMTTGSQGGVSTDSPEISKMPFLQKCVCNKSRTTVTASLKIHIPLRQNLLGSVQVRYSILTLW